MENKNLLHALKKMIEIEEKQSENITKLVKVLKIKEHV
jgi:hypothetical protein